MLTTLCAALAVVAIAPKIDDLAWLSGRWTGTAFGGTIEENFGSPSGGCMLGTSRIVKDGKVIHKEFIALEERDGSIVYEVTLPSKVHTFKLLEIKPDHVTWHDPANQWPKMIRYKKVEGGVEVTLAGASGEKAEQFILQRI